MLHGWYTCYKKKGREKLPTPVTFGAPYTRILYTATGARFFYSAQKEKTVMLELEKFPAVNNSQSPSPKTTQKYTFVPTTEILSYLEEKEWGPVWAKQVRSRSEEKRAYAAHVLRFRNPSISKETNERGWFPELVVRNSHDGSSRIKFYAGIFRIICTNGLIASNGEILERISVAHSNISKGEIFNRIEIFLTMLGEVTKEIGAWSSIMLSKDQQMQFALDASRLRFEEPSADLARQIVTPRRELDTRPDLWTTFNVIQENLVKGGFVNPISNRRTMAIRSSEADLKINTELWELGREFANANN